MSGVKFKTLFEGKQSRLEEKINVDGDLLSKLRKYKILTELQRLQIEVTYCKF